MKVENENPSKYAMKVIDYTDDQGRIMQERIIVFGKPPQGFHKFMAKGTLKMATARGMVTRDFWAAIPKAKDVKTAFELCDDRLRAKGKEMADEIRASCKKVVAAPGGIVDGKGRLIGSDKPKPD
jgi:hypothetical protein